MGLECVHRTTTMPRMFSFGAPAMEPTALFVSDGNIDRFVDLLHQQLDPDKRRTLRQLLIEEENRFGALAERLTVVDRHITNGVALISRQSRLLDKLAEDGRDTYNAERLLFCFLEVQELF